MMLTIYLRAPSQSWLEGTERGCLRTCVNRSGVQIVHTQALGEPGCLCKGNPVTSLDVSPHPHPPHYSTGCVRAGVDRFWWPLSTNTVVQPVTETPGSKSYCQGSNTSYATNKPVSPDPQFPYPDAEIMKAPITYACL